MPEMQWHPVANIFPMLGDDDFATLRDDIKKYGQREPIVIFQNMVLDGRNRWLACKAIGAEPHTRVFRGSESEAVELVMSLNLHRRHLTPSQASMCAARARDIYEKQAKERMSEGGKNKGVENLPHLEPTKARDAAGKAFGVSGKSVDHAKRVIEKGIPELAKAVDEGRMAVSTAAIVASETPEQQAAAIASQANRNYAKMAGRVKPEPSTAPESKKPRHAGEHDQSETFALTKADVAITQLKGIPVSNIHRDAALERVQTWINLQRKSK